MSAVSSAPAADSGADRPADHVHHPLFARLYLRLGPAGDRTGNLEHRQELLAGLSGRVLEVGSGQGLNFRHYPQTVGEVVAMEPEATLRERAAVTAERAAVPIRVIDGTASSLPVEASSFDAVVVLAGALLRPRPGGRPLRDAAGAAPRGELRFFEHVRSESAGLSRAQRLLDLWLWPAVGGGCHCSRDTAAAIAGAGFSIESMRRFDFRPAPFMAVTAPHIIGRAR